MSDTNQKEVKPVVIKFVSKERRSLLEKNESSNKDNKKLKTIVTGYESPQRSDLNHEDELIDAEKNESIKNANYGVSNTWLRKFDSPCSTPSKSPKKRVRWSEWNMVMEDGHRKIVSFE